MKIQGKIEDAGVVENMPLYQAKFDQAKNGDGAKNYNWESPFASATLALLAFYNITEERPLRITLDGHDVEFTESKFEEKLPVLGKTDNANLDVTLYGKDITTGKPVRCYIESKFTEYHKGGSCTLSAKYETFYKQIFDETIDVDVEYGNEITLSSKDGSHYFQGIKQMVSHAIGVSNKAKEDGGDTDIYLASVLYYDEDQKAKFDDYAKLYKSLAIRLNAVFGSELRVVPELLTYQGLVAEGMPIDKGVKDLYKL